MNVDEMPAGRELDALVAERVMGHIPCDKWTPVLHPEAGWLKNCQCQACYPIGDPAYYSTNIAAAWEVIGKLRQLQFTVRLSIPNGQYGNGESQRWTLIVWKSVYRDSGLIVEDRGKVPYERCKEVSFRAAANDVPLTICRAALKVMTE